MNKNELLAIMAKVNEGIRTTDIKGKAYAEVNQRIKAFRLVYPKGLIETEIVSLENGTVTMKAKVHDENRVLLGTGYAQEKENSSFINKTSYIENAETSAIGRALGICGFGIDISVASAEEVQNAIENQHRQEKERVEILKAYADSRSKLEELGCDFRGEKINSFILEHAKITSQNIQILDNEELKRLVKVYEGLINAKTKKD